MSRPVTVVAVLAAVVMAPVVGTVALAAETPTRTTTDGESVITPGDHLQGIVGVQEAELGGDIERRAFAIAFNDSETSDSKAAVVGEQATRIRERIHRLENRTDELRTMHEDGTIDESEFRAQMAVLAANASTARLLANATANASRRLPAQALENAGVDLASVRSLGRRASNLTGQEAAAIARSVAGEGVGRRIIGGNRSTITGPPLGVPGTGTGSSDGNNGTGSAGGELGLERPDGDGLWRPMGATRTTSLLDATGRSPRPHAFAPATLVSGATGPFATTDTADDVPLFTVGLRSTEPALVTLRLTFDLDSDTDRRAFETLQEDEDARADVKNRFQKRMQSVADNTGPRVEREMTVSDAEIALTTTEDTGIVTLSVVWSNLAGRTGDEARPNLVITEPFASGFTPSREFTVRIIAPEDYRPTRVAPDPMRQTETSASWAAGTSLDDFLLEFTPPDGTPLPEDALDQFRNTSTRASALGNGAPSAATLAVGGLIAISVAVGGFLAWRRRELG